VFLSVERFCSHLVCARIANRLRPRLAADIANLFGMLRPVNGLLDVCHRNVLSSTEAAISVARTVRTGHEAWITT
jgi:hypothetical protein